MVVFTEPCILPSGRQELGTDTSGHYPAVPGPVWGVLSDTINPTHWEYFVPKTAQVYSKGTEPSFPTHTEENCMT